MKIEIINTGSELLLGRVLNSHQQWLCRRLSDLGYAVERQVCVADRGSDIQQAVRESLERADLILTTGGLGPTSDDLTRDLIAQLLGRKLALDAAVLEDIERFFAVRNRPMLASMRSQAMVPEGAVVLRNAHGTAPGLALELKANPFSANRSIRWLIMLPGPPRELHPMFDQQVVPLVLKELPPPKAACRTLRVAGVGESMVEEKIAASLQPFLARGLELGYCARIGEVDVRLIARGEGAEEVIQNATQMVRSILGSAIFALDDESMESVVVRLLTEKKKTLALAESCTGGMIAHRVTNVPGASAVFLAGLVTYSNEAKVDLLGVRPETLAAHGAVSEQVASEMAEGVRRRAGVDFAVSVTGIAGPGGAVPDKPVGTVFMALAQEGRTLVQKQFNPFDRETFKFVTSQQALDLLRRAL